MKPCSKGGNNDRKEQMRQILKEDEERKALRTDGHKDRRKEERKEGKKEGREEGKKEERTEGRKERTSEDGF